ncbi:MAG: YlmC/YmxH family sporulation protein [Clostridia bacterium]|nr:YlmC/YmxH family sporulation protein [Clostridia bacterium]
MRLGCVDDVEIDTVSAKVLGVVVFGRLRFFGLFGREDDLFVRWDEISVVGDDTLLVNCNIGRRRCRKKFKNFFHFFRLK